MFANEHNHGRRLGIVVLLFFCNTCLYLARSNISVAVLYMFPICPDGGSGVSTNTTCVKDAQYLQGSILGAFYWGYFLSQVACSIIVL